MGNTIPKALSLYRRQRAWEMRIQNYTYDDICKELGISHNSVAKILTKVTKKYHDAHVADVERIKDEQLAQHETVAKEAYDAWVRSKESAKLIRLKESVSGTEKTSEARDQDGDPRYLETFMKAKEHIRKIIGANAPVKSEIKYSEVDNLSDDELRKLAKEAIDTVATSSIDGDSEAEEDTAEQVTE